MSIFKKYFHSQSQKGNLSSFIHLQSLLLQVKKLLLPFNRKCFFTNRGFFQFRHYRLLGELCDWRNTSREHSKSRRRSEKDFGRSQTKKSSTRRHCCQVTLKAKTETETENNQCKKSCCSILKERDLIE
jgi:hypothetical protein